VLRIKSLFIVLCLLFCSWEAFSQDLDLSTSEESKLNGSSMTQEQLLKSLSNNVILDLQDIEKCLDITKDSGNIIENSNQTIDSSDNVLNLSIEDEPRIKEYLTNSLTEIPKPKKNISPLGVNFIVGGTCIIFGFASGVAFTVWAINKFTK
jgi:hypothetical protein